MVNVLPVGFDLGRICVWPRLTVVCSSDFLLRVQGYEDDFEVEEVDADKISRDLF